MLPGSIQGIGFGLAAPLPLALFFGTGAALAVAL